MDSSYWGESTRQRSPQANIIQSYVRADSDLDTARARAHEIGCDVVDAETGSMLTILTAIAQAKTVVEIGTGIGVSSVYLLQGMRPDGVLTSIDSELEYQRLARQTFAECGYALNRVRLINGQAFAVLPRLADRSYDVVFIDVETIARDDYFTQALRILRVRGLLIINSMLPSGSVIDPLIREMHRKIAAHDDVLATVLPVGEGLLVVVKQA